ncbi:IS3 family transposase [Pseudoalteromonas ruthenica]|uniref:IS3 family transposase n=1 Tax=Pseudoalteromonas ruthenica TaxID=151081 RepID=UPI0009E2177A|nr:hypothetical protein CWC12_09450 [Pseudoalteromonas ruthenica]TMO92931.1 hypothetical protein CWC13_07280 [Pseudoalteromonas ruthenica]TMP00579.1 hypothetical protein CWC07_05075 [Pseudoalteromonas ruthenica]TMP05451.1 hypothetical protein CWC09_13645 [Pseudoalteromonas ruthenica]TMP12969.1 hypothetical protein CWC08_02700 [Pseudoalteromonas ruthenica]
MESFFSRFKAELVYPEKSHSIQHVKSCMFEYIEIFYQSQTSSLSVGLSQPAGV